MVSSLRKTIPIVLIGTMVLNGVGICGVFQTQLVPVADQYDGFNEAISNVTCMNTSERKAWTVLYYIDNDYSSGVNDALEQILIDEIVTTADVNVVVIQDKIDAPAFLYYIDENRNKTLLEELGEVNMGDPNTLSYFIDYGKQNYPADRYLLWIYDHGGGWKGACMDETDNDFTLTMDEFKQALTETGGVDIICFFACLMGSLECVYELRDVVDIYIGSEDIAHETSFDGICGDTHQLLTNHPEISNQDLSTSIVNFFPEHRHVNSRRLTMSAIKMDKVEPLVDALNTLAHHMITHWFREYQQVKSAHESTYLLADMGSWAEVFEVYDLKGFIQNLSPSSETTAVLTAFDEAVIAEVHGSDRQETNGLSIFFPPHASPNRLALEYQGEGYGLDFPQDTWWNEFLFFFMATNMILGR